MYTFSRICFKSFGSKKIKFVMRKKIVKKVMVN